MVEEALEELAALRGTNLPAVAASLLEEYEAHLHARRSGAEEDQATHTT
jgi:hypothetical protein